jgi:hypothetical protein
MLVGTRQEAGSDWRGREVVEIRPIILGGCPTDPSNRVLLDRVQHVQVVRYWNGIIRDLRHRRAAERAGGDLTG